jgi:hypothetical protein
MQEKGVLVVCLPTQMFYAGTKQIARAPDDSVNGVPFFQKQFSEVGAVLTGDAGNQRCFFIIVHDPGTLGFTNQRSLPLAQGGTSLL